jgi:hypothetical protein
VAGFAQELKQEALANIQNIAKTQMDVESCVEIHVRAGITEVIPTDEIDLIIEKARAKQEIVATHRCGSGGNER